MTAAVPAHEQGGHTPDWRSAVPTAESTRLEALGFGSRVSLRSRPCLLVIDVVMSFLGPRPGAQDDIEYATGCGTFGWAALPAITSVLDSARRAGIPRVLCKGWPESARVVGGAIKLSAGPGVAEKTHSAPFPEEIVPREDEFVLAKTKASAFFQTPLLTYLHQQQVDSLVIVGTTTSGCVRATAVDGASYGFPVVVVEDACFDRSDYAHVSNLFDIQMKYGEVVSSSEAIRMLGATPRANER